MAVNVLVFSSSCLELWGADGLHISCGLVENTFGLVKNTFGLVKNMFGLVKNMLFAEHVLGFGLPVNRRRA